MDTTFWILLTLAATLGFVTLQAHRIGNERRDVALLGTITCLLGAGAGAAAVL